MEIYVDTFIIQNTILNFCILHLSGLILKSEAKFYRYIIAALLGSIYSLLIFVLDINNIFIKAIVSLLMCYLAFKPNKLNQLIKTVITFYFVSFLCGGFVYGLIGFITSSPLKILGKKLQIHETYIIMGFALIYLTGTIVYRLCISRLSLQGLLWKIKINILEREQQFIALLDTGNRVKDKYTGYPVIFVQKNKCNIFKEIGLINENSPFFEMPVKTISGEEELLAIYCKDVKLSKGQKRYTLDNCVVCFTNNEFDASEQYSAVIGHETLLRCEGGK